MRNLSPPVLDRRQFCGGTVAVGLGLTGSLVTACLAPRDEEEEEGYDEVAYFQATASDDGHTAHGVILRRYDRFRSVPMRLFADGDRSRPVMVGGRPVSGPLVYAIPGLGGKPSEPHAYEIHYVQSNSERVWLSLAWHLQPLVAGHAYAVLRKRARLALPAPEELYAEDRAIIAKEEAWALG
ncbi:hypothetical protein EPN90_04430 [Patescibacteria group bacterium]|nr:MAG: hypothetical protein EPN90_04430 [Patescibacteria group bacterium]